MKESRKRMDAELKSLVVPFLRDNCFIGRFPHFKRKKWNKELLC